MVSLSSAASLVSASAIPSLAMTNDFALFADYDLFDISAVNLPLPSLASFVSSTREVAAPLFDDCSNRLGNVGPFTLPAVNSIDKGGGKPSTDGNASSNQAAAASKPVPDSMMRSHSRSMLPSFMPFAIRSTSPGLSASAKRTPDSNGSTSPSEEPSSPTTITGKTAKTFSCAVEDTLPYAYSMKTENGVECAPASGPPCKTGQLSTGSGSASCRPSSSGSSELHRSYTEVMKTSRQKRRYASPKSSRYCHLCARHKRSVSMVACGNLRRGTCQKSVCVKCISNYGLVYEGSNWTCPHCQNCCPARAKCYAYDRQTVRRREKTLKAKSNGSVSTPENAGISIAVPSSSEGASPTASSPPAVAGSSSTDEMYEK